MRTGDPVEVTNGPFEGLSGSYQGPDHASGHIIWLETGDLQSIPWGYFELGEKTVGDDDVPAFGMTSEELAQHVDFFIADCCDRITGIGADQYDAATHQKFEVMELADLFDWACEEAQDIAVYAAMLDIRIKRVKHAVTASLVALTEKSEND